MDANVPLCELREEDLDAVSGCNPHFGNLLLGSLPFGHLRFANLHFGGLFGASVIQTNTAVEIAVVIGGGNVVQVINQANIVA